MLDLAVAKSLVDIFKEVAGLIETGNLRKKDLLKEMFEPLYSRMEAVTKEYYSIIIDVRSALNAEDVEISSILKEVEHRRSCLVLARDGVIGEAKGLHRSYAANERRRIKPIDSTSKLVREFVDSIVSYFHFAHPLLERQGREIGPLASSALSGITDDLEFLVRNYPSLQSEGAIEIRRHLSDRIRHNILDNLESGWRRIAENYSELKIDCFR